MQDYPLASTSDEQIPLVLRNLPAWGEWSETTKPGGKPSKTPHFNTAKPETWRPWAQVEKVQRWSGGGVGFNTQGGYLIGGARMLLIDVDSCRVPRTGEVADEVVEWLAACNWTYTEVSPSGYGLRVVVAVADLAQCTDVRATCRGTWKATNASKAPGVQLFGLGPAGYVTMTGQRLDACSPDVRTVPTLQPILAQCGLLGAAQQKAVELAELVGSGPVELGTITRHVELQPYGPALAAGDWHELPNAGSASEAFHALARLALAAANGHGQSAVNWLLSTAWGRGAVHDSKDPSKYTRAEWVAKDVARAAAKAPPSAAQVFDVLPMPDVGALADDVATRKGALGDAAAVIDEWAHEGPLRHIETGIPSLDALTGGGLVFGSRVYLMGAPNAGKTALAVQLADVFMRQGIACGIQGVDEEPSDLAMRLMQRRGVSREACEARTPEVLDTARKAMRALPLMLFDGRCTIEAAAVALHRRARLMHPGEDRPPCVLFIDSVQTARCEGEDIDGSLYASVTRRVAAIRACASRYRMLVVVTSEMNRAAYKSKRVEDQVTDMAAGKESGAIEFSARVLLALRSVPGSPDTVEMRIAKNKHGRDHRPDEDGIFLRVDRAAQTLTEDTGFKPVDAGATAIRAGVADDAAAAAVALFERDLGVLALTTALQIQGLSKDRARAAREVLLSSGAIEEVAAPRGSKVSRLVVEKLPPEILAIFEARLAGMVGNPETREKLPPF